jgi:hypothetical protein
VTRRRFRFDAGHLYLALAAVVIVLLLVVAVLHLVLIGMQAVVVTDLQLPTLGGVE